MFKLNNKFLKSFLMSEIFFEVSNLNDLDKKCDIIVVSFHGGAEGSAAQHVPNTVEKYYGENRGNLVKFTHAAIDAGADVIFGHGPHVLRAMELYKNKIKYTRFYN